MTDPTLRLLTLLKEVLSLYGSRLDTDLLEDIEEAVNDIGPTYTPKFREYLESHRTLTASDLFHSAGAGTYGLLKAVHEQFECSTGEVQVLAHALLLGELFAALDTRAEKVGITEFWTIEHRLAALNAQIRRAYELAHETRQQFAPKVRGN